MNVLKRILKPNPNGVGQTRSGQTGNNNATGEIAPTSTMSIARSRPATAFDVSQLSNVMPFSRAQNAPPKGRRGENAEAGTSVSEGAGLNWVEDHYDFDDSQTENSEAEISKPIPENTTVPEEEEFENTPELFPMSNNIQQQNDEAEHSVSAVDVNNLKPEARAYFPNITPDLLGESSKIKQNKVEQQNDEAGPSVSAVDVNNPKPEAKAYFSKLLTSIFWGKPSNIKQNSVKQQTDEAGASGSEGAFKLTEDHDDIDAFQTENNKAKIPENTIAPEEVEAQILKKKNEDLHTIKELRGKNQDFFNQIEKYDYTTNPSDTAPVDTPKIFEEFRLLFTNSSTGEEIFEQFFDKIMPILNPLTKEYGLRLNTLINKKLGNLELGLKRSDQEREKEISGLNERQKKLDSERKSIKKIDDEILRIDRSRANLELTLPRTDKNKKKAIFELNERRKKLDSERYHLNHKFDDEINKIENRLAKLDSELKPFNKIPAEKKDEEISKQIKGIGLILDHLNKIV